VELEVDAGLWSRLRRRTRPRFTVASFRLAKYPITVAQWQAFLDDPEGYDALIRRRMGWEPDAQPGRENHPAVMVPWIEAMAFCQWLNRRLDPAAGVAVRLPTEWEWQQAATSGQPGWQHPWGPEWSDGLANTLESDLGRLTAVGLYPAVVASQGAMDLVGNVWEWCLNHYDRPEDTSPGGEESRVVRGGSWFNNRSSARGLPQPPPPAQPSRRRRLPCGVRLPHPLSTGSLITGY